MLKIIFGTESGNAEMAAEDMATVLTEAGIEAKAVAMDDYDVNGLTDEEHVILMTSTYGEGELPMTTLPFYESLKTLSPTLAVSNSRPLDWVTVPMKPTIRPLKHS